MRWSVADTPRLLASCLFLYAASFKTLDTRPLQRTIRELGVRADLARRAGAAAPFLEVALGVALVGFVPKEVSAIAVGIAGILIASAGARALRLGIKIPCGCFSLYETRYLGGRQIVLGLALLGVAAATAGKSSRFAWQDSAKWLIVVCCAGIVWHIASAAGDLTRLVQQRRAFAGSR